jgi:GntR family transcriptional regulator
MTVLTTSNPLGPASSRFLYRGVADIIRQRIASREYEPGAQLPTVVELSADFGVSTITIRRALRDLAVEGKLIGRQGLGVFVAEHRRIVRSLSVEGIAPIERDMLSCGVRPGLLDLGTNPVPIDDQPFLSGLGRGSKSLLRLDRLLLADDEPVGLDVLWMTHRIAEKLRDRLHGEFIMSAMEERGLIDQLRYQVEATTANEAQAGQLRVVSGFPLLVIRFYPVDKNNKLLLVGQTTTRADRFTYQFGTRMQRA